MANKNLNQAKNAKKDEFYTQLVDIENELKHYKEHFKNKVVLCNCDDPRVSNFFHYFSYNFEKLGLKKLITTCYKNQNRDLFSQNDSERAIWLEYNGDKNNNRVPAPNEIGINYFEKDGDFRSRECIELLKQYEDTATAGDHRAGMIRVSGVNWFTNLEIDKRHENLILYKKYNEEEYPKYDNYDAINVDKTSDIPLNFDGVMGVPITYLDKYNPEQFEIVGTSTMDMPKGAPYVSGKRIYERILIRRRQSAVEYAQSEETTFIAAEGQAEYNAKQ